MKFLLTPLIPVLKMIFGFIIGIFAKDFAEALIEWQQRRAEKKENDKRVADLELKVKALEEEQKDDK
jgi:hypothetical protein